MPIRDLFRRMAPPLAFFALAAAACVHHKNLKSETAPPAPAKAAPAQLPPLAELNVSTAAIPNVEATEASIRGTEFASSETVAAIYFEFDSSSLSTVALDTLKKNADYLKAHPEEEVLVAGFCDERGTVEYNLALGQKRAKEVRDYYIKLSVPGLAVATISYGKEAPACQEHAEQCWTKNRRAETRLRARAAQ